MEEIGEDDVYKAERILDTKNVKGKRFFLIKWDGWDESNNTWEPEKNIIDTRLIDLFYDERNLTKSFVKNLNKSSKDSKSNVDDANKSKFKNSNQSNEKLKEENELRSFIRVAEGLRPLSKSSSQSLILNKRVKKRNDNLRKINNRICDSSESASSSESSISNEGLNKKMKSSRLQSLKSTNRFMRRRKLSSSSLDSSSSSSHIPLKRRIMPNRIKKELLESGNNSEEEYELHQKVSDSQKVTRLSEDLIESLSKCYIPKESIGENVCITDVTSGVVTVTIKESLTPRGFFKNRIDM